MAYMDKCDCTLCDCTDKLGIDYPELQYETETTCGCCVLSCLPELYSNPT